MRASPFTGLEVAAALRARGLAVSVVSPDQTPLERVLGPELGSLLQRTHEANGVRFHLGRMIERIDAQAVTLKEGETLPADLVIVGIGVTAETTLAKAAGLELGSGGVKVDAYLETSAPGIYAAGDLAAWPSIFDDAAIRVEHWVVAGRQGQTAARNMLGQKIPYRVPPFFWTTQFDVTLAYVGHATHWDEIKISGSLDARDATVAYLWQGEVRAVATLGRDQTSLAAEAAFAERDHQRLWSLIT